MSQKFILSPQKTAKKNPFFETERPKRFTRKRSEREQSFDSKRSREDSNFSHYIKPPSHLPAPANSLTLDDTFLFLDQLSSSTMKGLETDRKIRRTIGTSLNTTRDPTREECTLTLKIRILETQMRAKDGECERFKLQADEERERRRKAQFQRKAIGKEAEAFQRQNQQLVVQIKKLSKEKEILNKQIEFLEKINYDEKTRNIQSFRQKHMQEELFRLRENLKGQKTGQENELAEQTHQLRCQKDTAQEMFRSMESLVNVQKKRIDYQKVALTEERLLTKQRIVRSDEYRELRDRFKRFIDQYKEMKNENSRLNKLTEGVEAQLVLSEEESDRS